MIDIIVLLIIIASVLVAAKRGFIKTAYGLVASLVALGVAFFLYPVMNAFLKITPLYNYIKEWNVNKIASLELAQGLQAQTDKIRELTEWLPGFIGESVIKNNNPEVYRLLEVNNAAEYIATYITGLCLSGLAIILTWIVVRIALGIIVRTLDLIAKLPLINVANTYAGAILGGAKAVLFLWLVGTIIPFLIVLPQFKGLEQMISNSYLTRWLYENNLLLNYLTNLFL